MPGYRRGDPFGHGGPWKDKEAWAEWWRGPAPRAERGVVRWLVLDSIAVQPRHGYEIIQAIGEKSGGAYRPSPGVVYPTLQMLEELGHARTAARGDRKVYEITTEGRTELAAHADEVRDFYEGHVDTSWETHAEDVAHLMKRIARCVHLFKRAMRRGTLRPSTVRRARGILDEALAKLEELLSPEEP
ncbi:MAG: PadR family transcriptional regulator [Polyangiaceae bacterium]|nr:PadR family transcriptional regulator [Polyangiaceae bacterium]